MPTVSSLHPTLVLRRLWRAIVITAIFMTVLPLSRAQQVTDGTNINPSSNRSISAGPFSEVSTQFGVLMTTLPIVALEGRGNTSIGFSIYHRSNQFAGSTLGPVNGGAGRGFTISPIQTVTEASDTSWNQGANSIASFTKSIINGQIVYNRAPGTHADMVPYLVGGSIRGWDITTQSDKTRYIFRQEVIQGTMYRLSQIVDTNGNTINYTYDSSDRPTQITDASSLRSITIGYTPDSNAQVSWVQLNYPGGNRRWDFTYNNWYLAYIDYPAPVTGGTRPRVSFHYDVNSNIDDVYDLKGHRWHYAYSNWLTGYLGCTSFYPPSLANPTTTYDSTGTTLSFSIFSGGPITDWTKTCLITDRRGLNWKHVYYNSGGNNWFSNPIKETWDGGLNSHDTYTWDYILALPLTHVDNRGNTTTFQYDSRGNLTQKTDREGWLWRWIYNQDKVVTQIDPTLNRTTYTYAPTTFNLTKTIVDPKTDPFDAGYSKPTGIALTSNFTYTATGEIETTWTGSDDPTTYSEYDAYGNAWMVTPPNTKETTFTFDALNNKLSVTEPSPGGTTAFTYDNWSRLIRTTLPDSTYTEKTYDNVGNLLTVRDGMGYVTTMTYDGMHRLTSTRQPVDANFANDIVVTNGYDLDSNRISVTNGRGKITYYDHDARNHLWRIRYPDNTSRQFVYDGNGNRISRIDGQGRQTDYSYDKENRLKVTNYPGTADDTENFWRTDGLRDRFTDSTGTTQFTYNGAKQLTSTYQPLPNKTVSYSYDGSGRRHTMSVGGQTWTLGYDPSLRLSSINQVLGDPNTATFSYNPNGSVSSRSVGAELGTSYLYDERGRVLTVWHRNERLPWELRFDYTYDENNNVLTYTDTSVNGLGYLPRIAHSSSYTYDRANRLRTEVRVDAVLANDLNTSYSYDKNGNRTTVTRSGASSSYSVDDNDKLLSGDGYSFSNYSADGNPASVSVPGVGTYSFTYDYENRVKQTAMPGRTNTFRYNADGQRVEQVSSLGTRRYVYDGWNIIAETDGSGNILTYFLPGVGYVSGGAQFYYRENALGSSIAEIDAAGRGKSSTEYDAYGVEAILDAGPRSQFRFAGKHGYQSDPDTGLDLLGHRYYAPKLGRFLTQDPIGHEGGLNLYSYCDNNPLAKVDPDGQDGVSDFFAGWGDALTFGFTKSARKWIGNALGIGDANEAVDFDSISYGVGQFLGERHQDLLTQGGTRFTTALKIADETAQVTKNLKNGLAVEERVRKATGGSKRVVTIGGMKRVVDSVEGRTAREIKSGMVYHTKRIKAQIAKDSELLRQGRFSQVVWQFERSIQTGKVGASAPLIAALKAAGIKIEGIK